MDPQTLTPSDDDIRHFLEAQADLGAHDSEGTFTVDARRAAVKSALYRFRDTGEYVLKFVQAAVAARADSLKVKVGVRSIECSFDHEALEPDQALKASRHFSLGVAGAGGRSTSVRIEKDEAETTLKDLDFQRPARLSVRCERPLSLSNLLAIFHRASEHQMLYHRAAYCPIHLEIDSWPIPRGWPIPKGSSKLAVLPGQDPFYLAWAYLSAGEHLPAMHFPMTFEKAAKPALEIEPEPLREGDCRICGAALTVSSDLQTNSRVVFVLDGAIVHSAAVQLGFPGLRVVASAEGLNTDLSTLRLVRNERYYKRCEALLRQLGAVAQKIYQRSDKIFEHMDNRFIGRGKDSPTLAPLLKLLPRESHLVKAWPRKKGP